MDSDDEQSPLHLINDGVESYPLLPMEDGEAEDVIEIDKQQRRILDRQLHGLQGPLDDKKHSLYSYATNLDMVVLLVSSFSGIVAGAANPFISLFFGELTGVFVDFANHSSSAEELLARTDHFAWYFVYLALVEFVSSYICTTGFYWSGERIVRRLRRRYLESIVRQNLSFFDTVSIGRLTTHITSDMIEVQEALTSKLALGLTAGANFLSAFVIAFIMNPSLALILCSILVAMLCVTRATSRLSIKNSALSKAVYAMGSNIAHEAILNIKQVVASNSQTQLADKYNKFLCAAEKYGIRSRVYMAIAFGWSSGMPNWAYALGFYAGAKALSRNATDVSSVVATTITVVNGSFAMLRVIPLLESFVSSISSINATSEIINRRSPMDPLSSGGIVPDTLEGNIDLRDVEVIYPSRRQTKALKGVTFAIPARKTTALVGLSGCGKSTVLGLLERFYEPTCGSIRLDGRELKDLNLHWLRKQMAYVGQEPTLFNTTIFENIRHGLIGSTASLGHVTAEDKRLVIQAAKIAYAHDFIMALPQGYDTEVRNKGQSLSGGQRQRIAIARAIVSDPKILLLDEATAALDTQSEKVIQKALDNAARSRTTIVIAHRLSTIRHADNIIVMQDGKVVDQGVHEALLARQGLYAELVNKHELSTTVADHDGKITEHSEKAHAGYLEEEEDDFDDVSVGNEVEKGDHALLGARNNAEDAQPSVWTALGIILDINRPERWYLAGGMITSTLASATLIIPAIWYANILNAFSLTDAREMVHSTNFWSLCFALTGIYGFLVGLFNGVFFAFSTERLARRVRDATLRSILRQNIGYFDSKAHDLGRMASRLSTSATDLTGLSGVVIGSILTFTSTIALALALGLAVGWKLSLFVLPLVPILAGLGWVRLKVVMVFDKKIRQAGEDAATFAGEVVGAIRVVASSGLERYVLEKYRAIQMAQAAESLGPILRTSALYAASQGINFLASALAFWYGSMLLARGEYSLTQYYICLIGLVWGAAIAGALFNFAPNMSKAALAAHELKRLFDRTPEIDSWDTKGKRVTREHHQGHLRLENVSFVYPSSTKNLPALRDISLEIPVGKFTAIVGASGSGKSTLLSLLERFYDPTQGRITLDGHDIRTLHLPSYRNMLSLVSQDPAIFSGTIKENLTLGHPCPDQTLISACRAANIHNFIASLPEAYDTHVGAAGSTLSGGQKQRLTISRAILRDAPILLLDEATAALDHRSEGLVLDALRAASRGRTTVAVAHRLATIRDADVIFVLDRGRLVERGTHGELLGLRGVYFGLVWLGIVFTTLYNRHHNHQQQSSELRYAGEKISWKPCGTVSGYPLECSRLNVPLDNFANVSSDKTFDIPLIRLRGGSHATHNLLINPGGPGGSGLRMLYRRGGDLRKVVGDGVHLLSFDPRGVNGSIPRGDCYADEETRKKLSRVRTKEVEHDSAEMYGWAKNFVRACNETMGEFGAYLTTPQTAADMNVILDAVGQREMYYWGFSYGTTLGQTYAQLYPERSTRIIIDGVSNAAHWYGREFDKIHYTDSENAFFHGFLGECIKAGDDCALSEFGSTKEELHRVVMKLGDDLKQQPMSVYVNNTAWGLLTYENIFFNGILPALYKPTKKFSPLATNLALLLHGNATPSWLAYSQHPAFSTDDESSDFIFNNDAHSGPQYFPQPRLPFLKSQILPTVNLSLFGPSENLDFYTKQQWIVPHTSEFSPASHVRTAYPILIVSMTTDPICPLVSAMRTQEVFEGSRLLEILGFGHCSVSVQSECADRVIRGFLESGRLPEEGHTRCGVDGGYFLKEEEQEGHEGKRREEEGQGGWEWSVRPYNFPMPI
ncbi:hypothetical protein AC578_8822 [Pseudocercospora eumusae]|uniref:Uncharacterized protein n=1 Tax=Pseudocercospora eumusae TaxID=321146 RepID=A0A139H4L6_9PEZI|nr:hypothetical protein AC578_8822 [Pseudocercospora eumusae]